MPALVSRTLLVALAVIYALLTWQVVTKGGLLSIDDQIAGWVSAYAGENFALAGRIFSSLGGPAILGTFLVLALIGLAVKRQWQSTLAFVAAFFFTGLMVVTTKFMVDRERPPLVSDNLLSGSSFPSASTALSAAVFFGVAIIAWPRLNFLRPLGALRAVVFVLPLAVGTGRILVSAHYLTDVIAALCIGLFFVLLAGIYADKRSY